MAKSINLRLPFQNTTTGGVFESNQTTGQALTDDLLSLMTAKRGSRVMRSSVYSPIFDFINEPLDPTTKSNLQKAIVKKAKEFLPQIDVLEVRMESSEDENLLKIIILFTSKTIYNIKQTLIISVPINNGTLGANI